MLLDNLKDQTLLSAQSLRSQIPKDIYDLLVRISREGFIFTLVGGAVRDYLLTGRLGNDFDFELKHFYQYSQDEWMARVRKLGERLSEVHHYDIEFLSFSILRVRLDHWTVEFAPARLELYQGKPPFSHSDFSAELVSCLSYEKAFKRRDFTVNALGIEFGAPGTKDEFKFIDPLGGIEDIRTKRLKACSEDFFNDPVRFLRLIRFSLQEGWVIEERLLSRLNIFDLRKFSYFYFFREAFKVHFLRFIKSFFKLVREHQILIPSELLEISFLEKHSVDNLKLKNVEQVLIYLIYKKDSPSSEEIERFADRVELKQSFLKGHLYNKELLEQLLGFDENFFREKFKDRDMGFFLTDLELKAICEIRQFVLKQKREDLIKLKEINKSVYIIIASVKELFPAKLAGQDMYKELIQNSTVEPYQRGILALYCHWKNKFL